MSIDILPIDPADEVAVEQAYQIRLASVTADLPDFPPLCRRHFVAATRHPMPGYRTPGFLALLDGAAAGYLEVKLPELDNVDNASVELDVHPAYRRRGVGRALHRQAARLVRELGRKRITGMTVTALPGGPPRDPAGGLFAAAVGATEALTEVRRRLDVPAVDAAGLDRMVTDAYQRAVGYSLVRWRSPTPEAYLDDVAYLESRLMADAPMGDLEWEPENVDADRVRRAEVEYERRGHRGYHSAVRHEGSGRIVGWTVLDVVASVDWHAEQQITLVDPGHRGHRLGTIVKIENLRYALAHEPGLRVVDTWNAATNEHMISINEAMGFHPVDGWVNWQLTV